MSEKDQKKNMQAYASDSKAQKEILSMTETTRYDSALDPSSQLQPFNSDDLYQKDGDYSTYEEMLNDDQVSVALNIKKDLVLGGGWQICVDDESQSEIKEDMEKILGEGMEVSLDEQIREILSAYEFGFSVSEKIFKTMPDGKIGLRQIKTRHPATWLLHQDDRGNVTKYEQRGITTSFFVPPSSLIHYVNNRRFSNPYGTSDLRAAYSAYFIKKQMVRFLAIFLEKAASPIPIAKYDSGVPNETVVDIFNTIKRFQTKTAMVIPKEFEIDFLESKSNGEAYHKAINLMNMFISRSMFIPDLVGFGGSETSGGSYSLGEHQINLFFNHINQRRVLIERIINRHVIRPLVTVNYGDMDDMPRFEFMPVDDKEAVELAKTWLEAAKGKTFKVTDEEINHFRRLVRFPESEESSVIETPTQTPPPMPGDKKEQPKDTEEMEVDDSNEKKDNFAMTPEKRINTKLLKSKLETAELSIKDEVTPIFMDIVQDYFTKIKQKKIIENEDLEGLRKLKIKKSNKIKNALLRHMRELFKDSGKIAKNEIRADFSVAESFDEDFLKFLDQENINYINDWEYRFSKDVRIAVTQAIKDGMPISSVIRELDKGIVRYTDDSIERYARTKFTEVMNKGRLAVFDRSPSVQGYQYSAILDARTTSICEGLHGKVFRKGAEPIAPMHFGCRSLLIPITIVDELNPDTKVGETPINKFIKDNIGKGFSKR